MSDPAPGRRLPRFSLRSLILLVVLISSSTGLWYRWEPWVRGPVLEGHSIDVSSAAYSPDGKRQVTTSWNNTARVWDVSNGKVLAVLKGHLHYVRSVAYSPDGRRIVTASSDKTARIWDADGGKSLVVLKGHSRAVWSAAYSPDGKCIVSASSDKTTRIWDAANGKLLAVLNGYSSKGWFRWSAAFSPDGKRIATASRDKTVRMYRRRRPEYWWGVAWLPEFWLTVSFALALGYSLWRDFRVLGRER